jgi:LPS-assembly protein
MIAVRCQIKSKKAPQSLVYRVFLRLFTGILGAGCICNSLSGNLSKNSSNLGEAFFQSPFASEVKQSEQGILASIKRFMTKEAREARKDLPVLISACTLHYDEQKKIFTAQGQVLVRQAESTLRAHKLEYHEKKDELFVCGNVLLTDPSGDRLSFEKATLKGDLKEGILSEVKLFTCTQERLTASSIKHNPNATTEVEMGSYTPCKHCEDRDPLWSLHARHMLNDDATHIAAFTDAHLRFFGVPVLYIPYFYLPTKRSSGFLPPLISGSKELGSYIGVPYYWALDESKDLTLTPFAMTKGGWMLAEEYRYWFCDGKINVDGALNGGGAFPPKKGKERDIPKARGLPNFFSTEKCLPKVRGYVHGNIELYLNDRWRFLSDEWWVSDQTFLSTRPFFGHSTDPYLQSWTRLEGFYPHHFFQVGGLRYQGLQKGERSKTTPFVYPDCHYYYDSPAFWEGSYASMHANVVSLYQSLGNQMQRALCEGQWTFPGVTSWGHEYALLAYANLASYHSRLQEESLDTKPQKTHTHMGRIFPQIGLEGKWPHAFQGFIVSPILQLFVAPTKVNSFKIPNEDSQYIEYTASNFLSKSRFCGSDRMDDGSRINVGLQGDCLLHLSGLRAGTTRFFLGQSFALSAPALDLEAVGIRKGASDIVGLLEMHFPEEFHLFHNFRCNKKDFSMKFQEIGWKIGPPVFNISGSYALRSPETEQFTDLKKKKHPHLSKMQDLAPMILLQDVRFLTYNQLYASLSSEFFDYWKGSVFVTQNFRTRHQPQKVLDKGIGLTYGDECFSLGVTVQHAYYRMNDLRPGFSWDFFVTLKNIGGIHQKKIRFSRTL